MSMKVWGIIAIILGVLAMLAPMVAGLSIAFTVGIFVTIAGIARLIWSFQAGSIGSMLLMFILSILTIVCGILMFTNPVFAASILTILLAAYFIADGIFEIAAGIAYRNLPQRGWLIFAGLISILLGFVLIAQYPLSGAWAIGILFGIKLFFVGIIMVMNSPRYPNPPVRSV